MRMRQALRERTKTTKAKLRKRVRLKLRLSEYSQKLQNSVFKRRDQPEVTIMEICVVKEKRSSCGTKRNRVEIPSLNGYQAKSYEVKSEP
ncbi:hypothetical protein TNCT_542561 [Trichonephila clavata]|uniref:Uncharacterized protein n=1 Tax=Trichonephila clavata TaxID=2740835 RepID=A0A8X6M1M0_TRICU|nr:hypothetical protein TNCT_542561 [Trichonephila clavata]